VGAAVAAALAIAGCARTVTIGAGGTLRVALTEYRVIPQDVRAHAGVLTLVVHNYGRLTHDLQISGHGLIEASTGPLAPGGTAVIAVQLAAGDYTMSSSMPSDAALGAYGSLQVAP